MATLFLVVVDVRSKWPDVIPMATANPSRTIEELRKFFTAHGLPEQLVSDNGPHFIAIEFRAFMRSYSIKHIRSDRKSVV